MALEPHIFQKDDLGWYVEMAGGLEGPLESCQDAQQYANLMQMVSAARREVVCLDRGCI